MSLQIPEDKLGPIKDAIFQNRKIDAIKLYRQCTGVGLAEAKQAVEDLTAELHTASPDKFAEGPPGSGGCFGLVLFLCLSSAGFFLWLTKK